MAKSEFKQIPYFAQVARDILSIPVCIVASESTFSTMGYLWIHTEIYFIPRSERIDVCSRLVVGSTSWYVIYNQSTSIFVILVISSIINKFSEKNLQLHSRTLMLYYYRWWGNGRGRELIFLIKIFNSCLLSVMFSYYKWFLKMQIGFHVISIILFLMYFFLVHYTGINYYESFTLTLEEFWCLKI